MDKPSKFEYCMAYIAIAFDYLNLNRIECIAIGFVLGLVAATLFISWLDYHVLRIKA